MFKTMRRNDKKLDFNNSLELLNQGEYGILSTTGEDGYAYGIPLNYVYHDNSIYFHCAKEGHKLQNLNFNNKVSFCVTSNVELLRKTFDTNYKSVIAFGSAVEVNEDEKKEALLHLIKKYSNEYLKEGMNYIENAHDKIKIIKIDIKHITGKFQE